MARSKKINDASDEDGGNYAERLGGDEIGTLDEISAAS